MLRRWIARWTRRRRVRELRRQSVAQIITYENGAMWLPRWDAPAQRKPRRSGALDG